MHFEDDQLAQKAPSENEVEIQVKAVGISTRDAETAMGHLPSDDLGMECSGVVTKVGAQVSSVAVGDRVAAVTPNGALSTVTRAHDRFLVKLPYHLSFEEAATIPLAYSTAYYSLADNASLSEGESVLIHHAATSVGQAAITIAHMRGAEVYATVRNEDEKATLVQHHGIPDDRIFFAGSDEFSNFVLDGTNGLGVDVVLNCLTDGELLRATWRCIAKFGRFVHVGHSDLRHIAFEKCATVSCVDVFTLIKERPRKLERVLDDVSKLLRYSKVLRAHPITSYSVSEATVALQTLHVAEPHGTVVIVPSGDEIVMVSCCIPVSKAS